MNKLSVIIPFLNEKNEVEATLKSLYEHTEQEFDVILINDASDDSYDYDLLKNKYKITYIKNTSRLGVAKCRDLGISMMNTPYFLLLDSHMRFYDNSWYDIVIKEIEKDEKVLLCCQSVVIRKISGVLLESPDLKSYGAYIKTDFNDSSFLDVKWINTDISQNGHKSVVEIPCILGAGYVGCKKYWTYMGGLDGLNNYGVDEQFISLKVWLTGGKCKLLCDVFLGHVYRSYAPYKIDTVDLLYNKMLLVELLLPTNVKYRYFSALKKSNEEIYNEAYSMLQLRRDWIENQRSYFSRIQTRSFIDFLDFNYKYEPRNVELKADLDFIDMERQMVFILTHTYYYQNNSICSGRCGLVILFLLWARKYKNPFFEQVAEGFLEQIYESLSFATNINFYDGLLGIGWCFEFLIQNNLIDETPDDILEEVDNQVMTLRCERILDVSLRTGIRGVVMYVLARIKGCFLSKRPIPFDEDFLIGLYNKIKELLLGKIQLKGTVEAEIQLLELLENKSELENVCLLSKQDIVDVFDILDEKDNIIYKLIMQLL